MLRNIQNVTSQKRTNSRFGKKSLKKIYHLICFCGVGEGVEVRVGCH